MTTPERLRRRQRREEILLILLGVVVGLTSIYFHGQDVKQRECISDNFSDLSASLSVRSDVAQREARAARLEAEATRLESRANSDFYAAVAASLGDHPAFVDAYGDYRALMREVKTTRALVDHRRERIAQDRADNPIPGFPEGTCQ